MIKSEPPQHTENMKQWESHGFGCGFSSVVATVEFSLVMQLRQLYGLTVGYSISPVLLVSMEIDHISRSTFDHAGQRSKFWSAWLTIIRKPCMHFLSASSIVHFIPPHHHHRELINVNTLLDIFSDNILHGLGTQIVQVRCGLHIRSISRLCVSLSLWL